MEDHQSEIPNAALFFKTDIQNDAPHFRIFNLMCMTSSRHRKKTLLVSLFNKKEPPDTTIKQQGEPKYFFLKTTSKTFQFSPNLIQIQFQIQISRPFLENKQVNNQILHNFKTTLHLRTVKA